MGKLVHGDVEQRARDKASSRLLIATAPLRSPKAFWGRSRSLWDRWRA